MREIKFEIMTQAPSRIEGGKIEKCVFTIDELLDGDFPFFEIDDVIAKRQYTGLKDKNGVEIYEGDIIQIKYKNYPKFIGKVFWEQHFLCYMVTSPHSVFSCMHLNEYEDIKADGLSGVYKYNERKYKVIGNIYENHELLEAQK